MLQLFHINASSEIGGWVQRPWIIAVYKCQKKTNCQKKPHHGSVVPVCSVSPVPILFLFWSFKVANWDRVEAKKKKSQSSSLSYLKTITCTSLFSSSLTSGCLHFCCHSKSHWAAPLQVSQQKGCLQTKSCWTWSPGSSCPPQRCQQQWLPLMPCYTASSTWQWAPSGLWACTPCAQETCMWWANVWSNDWKNYPFSMRIIEELKANTHYYSAN